MNRLAALIVVLFLAGCSSAPNYSGQWVGSVYDTVAGPGQGNLTISQSGSQLSGSWQIGFGTGVSSGSLEGIANGNSITAQLYPSDPTACPFNVTATRSGDTMNGNYAAFNCTGAISGTLSMTRQ